MLAVMEKSKEDSNFLDSILHNEPNNFSKVKIILRSIVENRLSFQC